MGSEREIQQEKSRLIPLLPLPVTTSQHLLTQASADEESRNALRVIVFFTLKNLTGDYFLFQLQGQKMDSCLISISSPAMARVNA